METSVTHVMHEIIFYFIENLYNLVWHIRFPWKHVLVFMLMLMYTTIWQLFGTNQHGIRNATGTQRMSWLNKRRFIVNAKKRFPVLVATTQTIIMSHMHILIITNQSNGWFIDRVCTLQIIPIKQNNTTCNGEEKNHAKIVRTSFCGARHNYMVAYIWNRGIRENQMKRE